MLRMDPLASQMDPRVPCGGVDATGSAADRRALVDKLAATLQARVLSGELPVGSRLRQEALRKLQASGLVELRPNRGALVRDVSPREIRDAYEVRAELEGLAAELAAR